MKKNKVFKYVAILVFFVAGGLFYVISGKNQEEPNDLIVKSVEKTEESEEVLESTAGSKLETGAKSEADSDLITEAASAVELLPISAEKSSAVIYVHVCGEVAKPDVYVLLEGTRVIDAVKAAGGFSLEAAKSYCNLATLLVDGQRVYIPSEEEMAGTPIPLVDQIAGQPGKNLEEGLSKSSGDLLPVNINLASLDELMQLPGIGKTKAEDILKFRREIGEFTSIEDIMLVPGIKEGSFEKIKKLIIV